MTLVGRDERISWVPFRIPFRTPFVTSSVTHHVRDGLIVRIETDQVVVGIGEAPVDIGFFGQTLEEVQAAIDDYLGPQVVGLDPFDREYAMHRIDYRGNSCAKSGIDLALHDLMGRALGVPVSDLIGGSHRSRVPVAIEIAGGAPADMAAA